MDLNLDKYLEDTLASLSSQENSRNGQDLQYQNISSVLRQPLPESGHQHHQQNPQHQPQPLFYSLQNAQLPPGQHYQGQLHQGQISQSQAPIGQLLQAQSLQGQFTQGQFSQGHFSGGQSSQGQFTQGQFSQGQFFQGQMAHAEPNQDHPAEIVPNMQQYQVDQENSQASDFTGFTQPEMSVSPTFPAGRESHQPHCYNRTQPLKSAEVKDIMKEGGNYTKKMPFKAEPGTVWRFDDRDNNQKNWRSQGYWWVEAGGCKYLEGGEIQKKTFNIRTPDSSKKRGDKGLQMFVWVMPNQYPGLLVIHIVGDKSLSVDIPHGNNKNDNPQPYYKTAASTMNEMKKTTEKPAQFYRQKRSEVGPGNTDQLLYAPRNTEQVRNHASNKQLKRKNGQTDSTMLLNVYASDHEDCRLLVTQPDLIMVNALPEMLDYAKKLLKGYNYQTSDIKILVGYDTQFNLTNGYVSWVCMSDPRHVHRTSGAPIILPLFQVIHERKLAFHHDLAWRTIVDALPQLASCEVVAVSDDEFTPLLQRWMKSAHVVKCENHGVSKIKFWVKQHGGRKDDCDIYAADFRHLIRAVSRANYNMRLINTVGRWTVEFQAYFYANINPEVELFSLWHAMELEFPTTDKIIFSSNMCETLNFMVKYIQDFKEVPLHHMFHLGRDIARGKLQEIAASYLGTGDYVMLPKYRSKRPIVDQNKSKRLLDKLQDVPTYKDLFTRLKMGQDITASEHRGATVDSEDDEHDVTDGDHEEEEEEESGRAPEVPIDAGLFAALRRFSVSPVNSPDCSMVEEHVTLEETELFLEIEYEKLMARPTTDQEQQEKEAVNLTLKEQEVMMPPQKEQEAAASPQKEQEAVMALLEEEEATGPPQKEQEAVTPPLMEQEGNIETVGNGLVEDTQVTKTIHEEPPVANKHTFASTREGPINNHIDEELPEEPSEAATAPVSIDITHAEPDVVDKVQQESSCSPKASISEASTASPLPPSLASPMSSLMSPGMSATMTRIPGTSVFVLPGRTVSFTVEPDKKHCGQCHPSGPQINTAKWCPHLVAAGQAMGMELGPRKPFIRSLTALRRNQRPDKHTGKSGKKKPRPGDVRNFSLIPVNNIHSDEALEEIQVTAAANLDPVNISEGSCNTACMLSAIEEAVEKGIKMTSAPETKQKRREDSLDLHLSSSDDGGSEKETTPVKKVQRKRKPVSPPISTAAAGSRSTRARTRAAPKSFID